MTQGYFPHFLPPIPPNISGTDNQPKLGLTLPQMPPNIGSSNKPQPISIPGIPSIPQIPGSKINSVKQPSEGSQIPSISMPSFPNLGNPSPTFKPVSIPGIPNIPSIPNSPGNSPTSSHSSVGFSSVSSNSIPIPPSLPSIQTISNSPFLPQSIQPSIIPNQSSTMQSLSIPSMPNSQAPALPIIPPLPSIPPSPNTTIQPPPAPTPLIPSIPSTNNPVSHTPSVPSIPAIPPLPTASNSSSQPPSIPSIPTIPPVPSTSNSGIQPPSIPSIPTIPPVPSSSTPVSQTPTVPPISSLSSNAPISNTNIPQVNPINAGLHTLSVPSISSNSSPSVPPIPVIPLLPGLSKIQQNQSSSQSTNPSFVIPNLPTLPGQNNDQQTNMSILKRSGSQDNTLNENAPLQKPISISIPGFPSKILSRESSNQDLINDKKNISPNNSLSSGLVSTAKSVVNPASTSNLSGSSSTNSMQTLSSDHFSIGISQNIMPQSLTTIEPQNVSQVENSIPLEAKGNTKNQKSINHGLSASGSNSSGSMPILQLANNQEENKGKILKKEISLPIFVPYFPPGIDKQEANECGIEFLSPMQVQEQNVVPLNEYSSLIFFVPKASEVSHMINDDDLKKWREISIPPLSMPDDQEIMKSFMAKFEITLLFNQMRSS